MPSFYMHLKSQSLSSSIQSQSAPDVTVVIPAFNRNEIIESTLKSVVSSKGDISIEIIIVDDGSDQPVEHFLGHPYIDFCKVIRQQNQGLLFARLTGLMAALGRYVLFLDSDDLISADKLASHVQTMDDHTLDISYTNTATGTMTQSGEGYAVKNFQEVSETADHAYFLLRIQPAPHSPVFRRDYLLKAVEMAPMPPSKQYNPIAEIYFYLVCSLLPARPGKCAGLAITCVHPGIRITNHWEPMGLAALAIMESFMATAPSTILGENAKNYVAEAAFHTWRALPYDFPVSVRRRFRAVACYASKKRLGDTGGNNFRILCRLLGPIAVGVILRRIKGAPYRKSKTMSLGELEHLIEGLDS